MSTTKKRMDGGVPPDPVVMKGSHQFGTLVKRVSNIASKVEDRLRQDIRLHAVIQFVLIAKTILYCNLLAAY